MIVRRTTIALIIFLNLVIYSTTFKRFHHKYNHNRQQIQHNNENRKSSSYIKLWMSIDWLDVISRSNDIIVTIKKMKDIKLDFSAGASSISLPAHEKRIEYENMIVFHNNNNNNNTDLLQTSTSSPPILVVHQLGKKVVRKIPNAALLGVLVLVSSELLQREINSKSYQLPPLLQEIANTTALELDAKLEFLSSLQWDLDPFLAAEYENLQTQPLEVIDKYIVKELLPRVDKELSPVLSRLITDPNKVKKITSNIKDLLNLGSSLLITERASRNQNDFNTNINKYTNQILSQIFEQVDVVGQSMEDAVKDWNKIIDSMNRLVKTDSVLKIFPNSSSILSAPPKTTTYQLDKPSTIEKFNDNEREK